MTPHTNPWTDTEILTALYLRDHECMTSTQIGQRMGRSRSSVLGIFHRVEREADRHDPDGIGNGTMPPRWWARSDATQATTNTAQSA